MKWRIKLSFQAKVLLSNLLIAFLLLITIFLFFSISVVRNTFSQARSNLEVVAGKIVEQIDFIYYIMDQTALQLASNPYIINTFNNLPQTDGNYFTQEPVFTKSVVEFINSYNFKRNANARICIYNKGGDFVYSGVRLTTPAAIESYFRSSDFQALQVQCDGSSAYYLPPREDPFSYSSERFDNLALFSAVRPVQNYSQLNPEGVLGYVEVQQPVTRLAELFTALENHTNGYLVQSDGTLLYGTEDLPSCRDSWSSLLVQATEEGKPASIQTDTILFMAVPLPHLDQVVLLAQSVSSIRSSLTSFWFFLVVTVILAISVIAVLEYMVIHRLTFSLTALQTSVDSININHLSWNLIPEHSNDEFARLNTAFQRMLEKLQSAIDQLVEARTGELKSHLMALQAQMDPHFLHNILAVIDTTAQEQQYDNVHTICNTLSQMLRYTSSYETSFCCMKDEFAHTVNYLNLMKFRYENRFVYTVECKGALSSVQVPKLILQPLAENCFQHGFKSVRPPWHIDITSRLDDTHWYLMVTDNGAGFSPQDLEKWNSTLQNLRTAPHIQGALDQLKIGGLCLTNICLRLTLMYGENAIMEIQNNPQGGSTITLGGLLHGECHGG